MDYRQFGKTDMRVSRLGVGTSEIGFAAVEVARAADVLNIALDNGVNFVDTAACYNISEELVGKAISHRRDDFYLATKAGHITGGYEGLEWTAKTISDSIDRSLKRMNTDYIDLVQLHSCSLEVLKQGEVIEALQKAQQEGKTRYVGYSGDNDAALWAVNSGVFDSLQTSFNLVEQKARYELFEAAQAKQVAVIVKRPIANSAWGAEKSPSPYAEQYFERAKTMRAVGAIENEPDNRIMLALGFAFAHEAIDVAIVGTKTPKYMKANIDMINNELPIAESVVAELHKRFDALGADWPQLT